jgi:uncharacterized membrane protein
MTQGTGVQIAMALVLGALVALALGFLAPVELAVIGGWVVAALTYVSWAWTVRWPRDSAETKATAEAEPDRGVVDVLVLAAAVASLVGVAFLLAAASRSDEPALAVVRAGLGMLSVVSSWALVHTCFALRYARLYYEGGDGGIVLPQDEPPRYSDFAYVAFNVGMSSQVSDTEIVDGDIRRTVLVHSLLSYLFNAGVLAAAINLVTSLPGT